MHITCFFLVKSKSYLRYCNVWVFYDLHGTEAKKSLSIKLLNRKVGATSSPHPTRKNTRMADHSILLLAGEASGDHHAAAMVRELRLLCPEITVSGIGGDKLAAAGWNSSTITAR